MSRWPKRLSYALKPSRLLANLMLLGFVLPQLAAKSRSDSADKPRDALSGLQFDVSLRPDYTLSIELAESIPENKVVYLLRQSEFGPWKPLARLKPGQLHYQDFVRGEEQRISYKLYYKTTTEPPSRLEKVVLIEPLPREILPPIMPNIIWNPNGMKLKWSGYAEASDQIAIEGKDGRAIPFRLLHQGASAIEEADFDIAETSQVYLRLKVIRENTETPFSDILTASRNVWAFRQLTSYPTNVEIYWRTFSPIQKQIMTFYPLLDPSKKTKIEVEALSNPLERIVSLDGLTPGTVYAFHIDNEYSGYFSTDSEHSLFAYPPLVPTPSIDSEKFDVDIDPYAQDIEGKPTGRMRKTVRRVKLINEGKEAIQSPFLYSAKELNFQNLFVLKNQFQKMLAKPDEIARYVFDRMAHMEHLCAAGDLGYFPRDPLILINGYNYECCDQSASSLAAIMRFLGYSSRMTSMNGTGGHSVAEVSYEDDWHMFDADLEYFFDPNSNSVLSYETLYKFPELIPDTRYRKILTSTTSYWYVPIFREDDLEGRSALLFGSKDKNYAFINWNLYPGESFEIRDSAKDMKPLILAPYRFTDLPKNYGKAIKTIKIEPNANDPRISMKDRQLGFYVFSALPLVKGKIKVAFDNPIPLEARAWIVWGQDARKVFSLGDMACVTHLDKCVFSFDVESMRSKLNHLKMRDFNSYMTADYPAHEVPQYYVYLDFKHEVPSLQEVSGYVETMASSQMLPRRDIASSYHPRDLFGRVPDTLNLEISE